MGQRHLQSQATMRPGITTKLSHPSKSHAIPAEPPTSAEANGRISTVEVHHLKCLEGNCMRNFSPADERWPQGLPTRLRTLTVRAFSGCSAKNSPSTGLSVAHPRKNSPSIGLPVALPRKNSPGTPKKAFSARFGLAGRTISRTHPFQAAQGELFRA